MSTSYFVEILSLSFDPIKCPPPLHPSAPMARAEYFLRGTRKSSVKISAKANTLTLKKKSHYEIKKINPKS